MPIKKIRAFKLILHYPNVLAPNDLAGANYLNAVGHTGGKRHIAF